MSTITSRLTIRLAAIVALALLASGCAGEAVKPADNAAKKAAPTPSATAAANRVETGHMSAEEVRWLNALERLLPRMNKVFEDIPSDVTTAALVALANGAGGCSRELARMGPASTRLQPVEALVQQACREYDKGAKCFADVARMAVLIGSATERKLEQQIECGFAASATGGMPLGAAVMKAQEIKAAVG
jgi:hypothetical protein